MDKRKLYQIEILFKISIEYKSYKELFDRYIHLLQTKYSNINFEKFKKVKDEFNIDKFTKRAITIYDDCFSEKEIQEIMIFYNSDVGKKYKDIEFKRKLAELGKEWVVEIDNELSKISREVDSNA